MDWASGLSLTQGEDRWPHVAMTFFSLLSWALLLSCLPPKREFLFVTSYRHLFWQFFSESPSSSSPMMSTAENINATRMAKQQTRAKTTMHFCWDCGTGRRWREVRGAALLRKLKTWQLFKIPKPFWKKWLSSLLSGWKSLRPLCLFLSTAFDPPTKCVKGY